MTASKTVRREADSGRPISNGMNHHAYLIAGDSERGMVRALAFIEEELGLGKNHPDRTVLSYDLFSVDDARTLSSVALRHPVAGDVKAIIISAQRFFHEAQNALLKLFEEPPTGTYLFLVLPSEGLVIPTLRSRLLPLSGNSKNHPVPFVTEFLEGSAAVREKIVSKLLERAKSDKDEEKQRVRADALLLLEGLTRAAYVQYRKEPTPAFEAFLSDLTRFIPILHERSAPLKPIFEHLLLTLPRGLTI
jgi:DNA polymerase III, delta subunit